MFGILRGVGTKPMYAGLLAWYVSGNPGLSHAASVIAGMFGWNLNWL